MRKIYYYIELENISPIHVGNGEKEYTDLDLIKDQNNQFYIPGTSLAGSIIHHLSEKDKVLFLPRIKDKKPTNKEETQTKQSPIFISDAIMKEETSVEVRDGIKLNAQKVTEYMGKYDYEVIPAGKHFIVRMEVTDRDGYQYEELMNRVFTSIQNHDIKVGYKTTRGLGRLAITQLGKRIFDENNFNDYFTFDRYCYSHYDPIDIKEELSQKYLTIEVELQQKGGISIRTYNTSKDEVDYEHITSNGKPIIPATSWSGLLRKTINHYMKEFHLDLNCNDIFGCTLKEGDKVIHKKSLVYIDESIIEGGEDKIQSRIKINPFHGGTANGALFHEKAHYGGHTKLTIYLDKTIKDFNTVVQLFVLTFKDLDNGFIALGGETSIGRGLFKVKNMKIDGKIMNVSDYIEEEGYSC